MGYHQSKVWQSIDLHKYSGKRICVACSGGADSICLLHFMLQRKDIDGFSLCAVHCEHGIRGEESKKDEKFVFDFCKENKIELFTFSANCIKRAKEEKISLETAARNFRYESFSKIIQEGKADFIATAHHLDDEAETTLFHLLRGASLTGAGGIAEEKGKIIRPFLNITKAEILEYLHENHIAYCTDKTNFDTDVSRNKLRLDILPKLEEIVPGSAKNLARFSGIARSDDEFLYSLSESLLTKETDETGKIKMISVKYHEATSLFYRASITAMKMLGIAKDYTYAHLLALQSLFTAKNAQTGKEVVLPRGVLAKRRYDKLVFFIDDKHAAKKSQQEQKVCYGETDFLETTIFITTNKAEAENYSIEHSGAKILYADAEKIENCIVRQKRTGDIFEKFGGGTKILKKYLTDKKISAEDSKFLPLICDGSDVKIVCGVEIADSVKVTNDTRKIAYIITTK